MKPLKISFGEEVTGDYSKAREKEWLITNGIGGYASSTITGANTRGYHGLLVASTGVNLRRTLLLSKMEEEVIVGGRLYLLSTNKYPGVIHPEGYKFLKEFRLEYNPQFIFDLGGVKISKTVQMAYGCNSVTVTYETDASEIDIALRPLTSNRGLHGRLKEASGGFTQHPSSRGVVVKAGDSPSLTIEGSHGDYEESSAWYRNMVYDEESERGLEDREALFSPGRFHAKLGGGQVYSIVCYADPVSPLLVERPPSSSSDDFVGWLTRASEQFVARLPDGGSTIIAGYHWFGEWGRDAAISLPGLLLTTGRFGEARGVIQRFLAGTRGGLTPNLVGEDGEPLYNSVDASLWLVYAAYKYHLYTGDDEFIREIYPELLDVVSCCRRGNVCVGAAADGLLESVAEGSSFTWMDARVDGLPVTPRVGKCVEVNALYYNTLRSLEFLGRRIGEDPGLVEEAECVKKAFNEAFWYQEGRYLYDCLDEDSGDKSLRPNQILAISLPFPVLEEERWGAVYKAVERELLTPYGLRTLSPRDPRYRGRYLGGPGERDYSYHNGTAWAWLIGPFITAHVRLGFSGDAIMVRHVLNHFKQHLSDAGLGSVSEIFDGDPPYRPRGCIAQAWSVGELLRVMHEDLKGAELNGI